MWNRSQALFKVKNKKTGVNVLHSETINIGILRMFLCSWLNVFLSKKLFKASITAAVNRHSKCWANISLTQMNIKDSSDADIQLNLLDELMDRSQRSEIQMKDNYVRNLLDGKFLSQTKKICILQFTFLKIIQWIYV